MPLPAAGCLEAIARHSEGFADAARGHLAARVEHCPGWSVADLVWHLTEVHRFWATIAAERPPSPPDPADRPVRPPDPDLVAGFVDGAARLVDVLGSADPDAACWTWAPRHQNVGFIVRHQVQEAAVHHWDVANAAGHRIGIEPAVAADAVDEFLDVSLDGTLDGALELRAVDTGDVWTVGELAPPGPPSLLVAPGPAAAVASAGPVTDPITPEPVAMTPPSVIAAPAADLLLWLYNRVPLDTGAVPADLLTAFRGLTSTE
jgi:uncharacterized protein (TIGR03083 family)